MPTYHVIPHVAHADVAQMCFRYVSVLLKQKPTRGIVALLKSFPMLSYILSSGFNHIALVDPGSTVVVLEALQSLGSDVRHYPSHWDCLCELREDDLRWPYPPWPTSRHDFVFYMLIAYSSPALLESFLSTCGPLKPRVGTNPLVYAADLQKTKHALVLLACGADMNVHGVVVDDSHKALPLNVAINLGNDVLVGELLQRGCVVTSEVLSTAVCMPWCSTRVLAKLMQTDEFVEWANNIGDEKLYRGVFNSARPNAGDSRKADEDHVALARRLRQIGQNLSADSPFGAELIQRAVHAAHTSMLEYLLPPDRPPPPQFLLAASTGNTSETVSVVHFLLRRGADINAVSTRRRDTALHLAAMCPWEPRSLELTQMLINAGCRADLHNLRGETPMIIAVQRGYLSVVEHLLSSNVSFPPDILQIALRGHSPSRVVEFLIHRGADVNSTTSIGDTVLHLAIHGYIESTCLDLVKRFIKAGCNATSHSSKGKTVFEVAIKRGYSSVVEYLLSCNFPFPPNILPFALQNRSTPQIIESLIHKGADVLSTTSNGDSIFHLAISKCSESTGLNFVKIFIEAGCNTTTPNSEGKTIFDFAFQRGYTSVVAHLSCNLPLPPDIVPMALQYHSTIEMVKFLIRKGADVHFTTPKGGTVLHLAVAEYNQSTCLDLVKIFIEASCNTTTRNSEGKTVFEVAIKRGYSSVVEHLLSCNFPFPPNILPFALQNRSTPQIIESLIHKGADVLSTTSNGSSVLHLAIAKYSESSCLNLVKIFIEAGCDPTTHNSKDQTAFKLAIGHGYTSVVDQLLSCNLPFPPNSLPIALQDRSTPEMVEFLIRKGADVHSATSYGDTVLHLAVAQYVESTCLKLVKSFIRAGCNPTTRNSAGKTVFEVAIERHYTSVVEHLLSCKVPFPPDILPIALQNRSTPQMVESLIRNHADVNFTTADGDTVLHLAVAKYVELTCLDLAKILINAGSNPILCDSHGETVLEAAMKRGYALVTQHLLSCNLPLPPIFDVLSKALQRRCIPQIIQLLVYHSANDLAVMTESHWDTLLQFTHDSYIGVDRQWVVEFLEARRKAKGSNPR